MFEGTDMTSSTEQWLQYAPSHSQLVLCVTVLFANNLKPFQFKDPFPHFITSVLKLYFLNTKLLYTL